MSVNTVAYQTVFFRHYQEPENNSELVSVYIST